jgi:transposase
MGRTADMKIAIGIDVHKDKCTACAVYAGTDTPRTKNLNYLDKFNTDFRRFPSDATGMIGLMNRLQGQDADILIENSTKSHDVYWMLTNLGLRVTVAHAADLYRITKSKTKNDDNDATELAGYMRRRLMGETEFAVAHMPSREVLAQRELCRFNLNDRNDLSALKKQIRAHLLIRGSKLSRNYSDITSVLALRELKATGDHVLILDAAKAESIKARKKQTEKMIRYRMENNRMFDIIWSIPGFGILSAAYVTCMADNMVRFKDGRAFAASAGITPRLDESADRPKNCGISRRGDPELRRLLCQATFVHINHTDSFISEKYKRLRANGKHHNEALVACANSMARMIWAMVTQDRKYSADPAVMAVTRYLADSDEIEDEMEAAQTE